MRERERNLQTDKAKETDKQEKQVITDKDREEDTIMNISKVRADRRYAGRRRERKTDI